MKLTTAKLKEMMTEWLSTPEMEKYIKSRYEDDVSEEAKKTPSDYSDDENQTTFEYTKEEWKADKNITSSEDLLNHIWNQWKDSSKWKRGQKCKLKEEAPYVFGKHDYSADKTTMVPNTEELFSDHWYKNKDLVIKYFDDPKAAEKCIMRTFVPDNPFGDNFVLTVITTPEDDQVIMWDIDED